MSDEKEQTFLVYRPEVHYSIHRITAKSAAEAMELCKEGLENEIAFEYSHTLDTFKVEKEETK